jgi:signal transduction histidine kinase
MPDVTSRDRGGVQPPGYDDTIRADAAVAVERATDVARADAAIRRTVERIAAQQEFPAFLHEALAEAMRFLGCRDGAVYLYEAGTDTIYRRALISQDLPLEMLARLDEPLPAGRYPHWRLLLASRETMVIEMDFEADDWWPESAAWHGSRGNKTFLVVPMLLGERLIGYFDLALQRDHEEISSTELEFVQAIAQQATLGLLMSNLSKRTREAGRAKELAKANEALRSSLDMLAGNPELSSFLHQVLVCAMKQLRCADGGIFIYDPTNETLQLTEAILGDDGSGMVDDARPFEGVFPTSEVPVWARVLATREVILSDLEVHEHIRAPGVKEWHRRRGNRIVVASPMILGDRPIGYLGLGVRRAATEITAAQIELVRALTQQATLALHITRLAEQAKDTAITREQEAAARERAAEMARANAVLRGTLDRLASEEAPDAFLGHVLSEIVRQSGAYAGHLFVYEAADSTLRLHSASRGGVLTRGPLPDDPPIFRAPISPEITFQYLFATRHLTWLPVDEVHHWRRAETLEWHRRMGHLATAGLALFAGKQPVGALGLEFRTATPLTTARAELVQALATQAALALELMRLGKAERSAAVVDERNALAREIHDTIAQSLALIVMQLADAETKLGPAWAEAGKSLDIVRELAVESLASARRSVSLLRPNAGAELPQLIRAVVENVRRHIDGKVDFRVDGNAFFVAAQVEAELAGIAREALTNAAKHSRATHVRVELAFVEARTIRLAIFDNGVGFDPDRVRHDAYGLVGMHERAARIGAALTFVTESGAGTEVVAAWPA